MINKVNESSKKYFALIFILILISSCAPYFSDNMFERNITRYSFSFGIAGYNDTRFCRKNDPNFIYKYKNGVKLSRICDKYEYYTCHITHYCPNLPTETERKKCEFDAAQYWTPIWRGTENDLKKRVEFTKESCDIEAAKNNQSQPQK